MASASASNGPRYAPEDPTLPKPWRGLIDGKTGYLYFWNPETNVTQYERPVVKQLAGQVPLPPPPKANLMSVSSSVQHRDSKDDDGRSAGSRSHHHHSQRGNSASHSQSQSNAVASVGLGGSHVYSHGHSSQNLRSSAKGSSNTGGVSLSTEAYKRQHEITVLGDDVPAPLMTFESTGFTDELLREVRHAGFSSPTPIQAQAWPVVMQSRDVVAVAKTGSGKTLGYLLPGFMHINRLRNNSRSGPTVLVLAPTRELATQILDEAVKFGRSSKISSTCLYGGAPKGPQLRDIDRGVDIVVATPGRLNDILEMRRISLRQVSYIVLDEADRMLDMGFEPQIRKIVKEIPPQRQTLMFTATWPKEVRKIASDLLIKPVQVNIGSIDELVANKAITQYVEIITPMEKQRRLEQILRSQEPGSKILIFCSTKRMCDQLARSLTRQFGASAIHGDKSQNERDYVLGQFRTGRSPILVATDVAARGLDVKDVRVVINYDFPSGIEDYVHRIGRTGRAGATGVSYTLFSDQDAKHASDLIKVLEGAGQLVPREIRDMSSRSRGGGRGQFRRWASTSGGRDGGRSNDSRNDSGYGGRGEYGMDGRSEGDRGGRGPADRDRNDRNMGYSSYLGDSRARHESERKAGERDLDSKSARGSHDRRAGDRDTGHGRGRSRSPGANRGRGVVVSRRSRSWSSSKDRGRSPSRRSRSRSRSLGRRHAGGVLRRESSPKDAQVATRGLSPADRRAVGYSHPELNDGHLSAHMQDQQDQLRSPTKGHSPRHASGYDRSPNHVDDRSAPGLGRSLSTMEDRPAPGYGRSPTPMEDMPAPGYGPSPTPMDDGPAPGYARSPTYMDERPAPGYGRPPTPTNDTPVPGYGRSPTPMNGKHDPGYGQSTTLTNGKLAPGYGHSHTRTDEKHVPVHVRSPTPLDNRPAEYKHSPTPINGPAPGYNRSPSPMENRPAPRNDCSPISSDVKCAPVYDHTPTVNTKHAQGRDHSPILLDGRSAHQVQSPIPMEERHDLSRYNHSLRPRDDGPCSPFPSRENGCTAQEFAEQHRELPKSGDFSVKPINCKAEPYLHSNPAKKEGEGMIVDEVGAGSAQMQE